MPLPILRVVRLGGLSILKQLHIEEVLLRRCSSNYLILNSGMREEDTAVVLGLSGKIGELVNVDHFLKRPIHLIRRYTGGGTVVVDKSTLFATFIMNSKDAAVAPYPRDIMRWSEGVYKPVFDEMTKSNSFSLRENDYVLGDRKVGGNAQTITKNRWVHHTSFLWSFDPAKMQYLQLPKKRPDYRADRDHGAFLTKLEQHVGSVERFEAALGTHLEKLYQVLPASRDEIEAEVSNLLGPLSVDSVARTRLESIEDYLNKQAVGLVKQGPSCVNL